MTRRLCLLAAAAVMALLHAPAAAAEKDRPNVLFIAVDDMNNDLGCYGHPVVKSPHLDRLAREGTRFDRAYCQFPLCSPSRTSIMTGLRPDRTGVHDLQKHFRDSIPDVVTIPQLFRRHGYWAGRVGKIYHYGNPGQIGTAGLDDPASWDHTVNPAGRDKLTDEPDIIQYTGQKMNFGASLSWLAAEGSDSDHTDGKVADAAISLMEQHRSRPFFLAVGFYKPHTPYVAPKRWFDLYPEPFRIPLAALHPGDWDDIPAMARNNDNDRALDDDQRRLLRRAYWSCISFADAQIGRLLDALDRLDLRRRTIVVFWSDHGYLLGEHSLWQKQSCFEEAARVPLIISAPDQPARGKAVASPVELVDLYPTLADLAGLPPPPALDGASLRPSMENPDKPGSRPAFTQTQRGRRNRQGDWIFGRSVTDGRFRYTEWDGGKAGRELYDHRNDPREFTNLADTPAAAADRERLAALLHRP